MFYVYVYFRLNGIPCYVGKGKGDRWKRHRNRETNPHLRNLIKQAAREEKELPCVIIREHLTEKQAFEIEIAFIKAIGREDNGGPLVNLTDGGEGPSGLVFSEKAKKKMSLKALEMWANGEKRLQIIEAQIRGHTAEGNEGRSRASKKMWEARREELSETFRLSWTPERRKAQSERLKRAAERTECIENWSRGAKNMWAGMPPEKMEKISEKRTRDATNWWAGMSAEEREELKAKLRLGQQRRRQRERELSI